jgi:AraC-like DNA-binding protein
MVRPVILLAPVFVSLFWAFVLMSDNKGHHVSRRYLSVFMLLPAMLMFCHFLYFAPSPDWFVYFDLFLQYFGLLVFPLFHIYFRLLTVDDKISLKKLLILQILPILYTGFYAAAVLNSSMPEYKAWLFNKTIDPTTQSVQFLQIMRIAGKIIFTVQSIYYIVINHLLINKYASRAVQFYSDVRDAKTGYAKLLNLSIIMSGGATLILYIIGRAFLMSADGLIFLGWSTLTASLFLIGKMGARQKVINPDIEQVNDNEQVQLFIPSKKEQNIFINKILHEFEVNRIYLKQDLTIHDLAKIIGSNRTYLSFTINHKFNQNFCAFVNGFRVKELERILMENPDSAVDEYIGRCGFGSVNSMKRSISAVTGLSLNDFKSSVLKKVQRA